MKHSLAILFLASTAAANTVLIDQTPGGYYNQTPPAYFLLGPAFFDDAHPGTLGGGDELFPPGWTSQFGILNGGTLFNTDLLTLAPTSDALVQWDFTGTTYRMTAMLVSGFDAEGNFWNNIYTVRNAVHGQGNVTINGTTEIGDIAFYGRPTVPEGGNAVTLLALGLVALASCLKFGRLIGS